MEKYILQNELKARGTILSEIFEMSTKRNIMLHIMIASYMVL